MDALLLTFSEPSVYLSFSVVLGLLVGSFLNVVSYRLPLMLKTEYAKECREFLNVDHCTPNNNAQKTFNLMFPHSHCPHCEHSISMRDNIPLISYYLLRGRCRHCQHRIHWQYPLVEAVCAAVTFLVTWHFGWQLLTLGLLLLTWNLIVMTVIDLEHLIIPDELSLSFLWLGLLININDTLVPLHDAVLGAAFGYLSLWSIYWIFKIITGKEGMGYGDFKLTALLGAWFGWQQLPLIVFLSACIGLLFGMYRILIQKHSKDTPFAFGPFISLAGFIAMIWGKQLLQFF
jgi:leader peptidase (prepilin peptidase)/N-methyltransferase